VNDLDAAGLEMLTPTFVLAPAGLEAEMPRPTRAMLGDQSRPLCQPPTIEHEQHAGSHPKRDAVLPSRDRGQPEQLPVEAFDGLPSLAVVVEHGLEHADEMR
jgi:hypothetical protein